MIYARRRRRIAPLSRRSPRRTACASAFLVEARRLDARYAAELAGEARSSRSPCSSTIGSSPAPSTGPALRRRWRRTCAPRSRRASGAFDAAGERHAYLLVQRVGPAAIYAVASITAARDRATRGALPAAVVIVAGGLVLCLLASISLARRVAAPIDRVSRDIHAMVDIAEAVAGGGRSNRSRSWTRSAPRSRRCSRPCTKPRAETSAAYLGAIRALVAALDARDPYTAGHSERVSALSVAIGPALGLGHDDLDVLRLGALLHDIGKIGITDAILSKPAPLTDDEFEAIKRHTVLGAHILRPIALPRPAHPDRRAAPRAARRPRLSARPARRRDSAATPASSTSPTPSTR